MGEQANDVKGTPDWRAKLGKKGVKIPESFEDQRFPGLIKRNLYSHSMVWFWLVLYTVLSCIWDIPHLYRLYGLYLVSQALLVKSWSQVLCSSGASLWSNAVIIELMGRDILSVCPLDTNASGQ